MHRCTPDSAVATRVREKDRLLARGNANSHRAGRVPGPRRIRR